MKIFAIILLLSVLIYPQVNFDDYFLHKTLRLDYFHSGNKDHDTCSFDELKEEPYWSGNPKSLIDPFNVGAYKAVVYDDSSDIIIYTHTYATLFHEWQTTDEARITLKTFSETVTMPFPKKKVKVKIFGRDRKNNYIIK